MQKDWAIIQANRAKWPDLGLVSLNWIVLVKKGSPMDQREINYEVFDIKPRRMGYNDSERLHAALRRARKKGQVIWDGASDIYVANLDQRWFSETAEELLRLSREREGNSGGPVPSTPTRQGDPSSPTRATGVREDPPSRQNQVGADSGRIKPAKGPLSVMERYILATSVRAVARTTDKPKSTISDRIKKESRRAPSGIALTRTLKPHAPWGKKSGKGNVLAIDIGYFGHKKIKHGRITGRELAYAHIADLRTHDPLAYVVARAPAGNLRKGNEKSTTPFSRKLRRVLGQLKEIGYSVIAVVSDLDKPLMLDVRQGLFQGRKDDIIKCRFIGCFFHFKMNVYRKLPTRRLEEDIWKKEKSLKKKKPDLSPEEIDQCEREIRDLTDQKIRYCRLRTQLEKAVCAPDEKSQETQLETLRRMRAREEAKIAKAKSEKLTGQGWKIAGDKRVASAISFLLENKKFFPPLDVLHNLGLTNREINWRMVPESDPETGPTNDVCENAVGQIRLFWNTHKGFRSVASFQKLIDYYWWLKRTRRFGKKGKHPAHKRRQTRGEGLS